MINIRFIISTLLLFIIGLSTPAISGEYKVLIIPNSSIDLTKKNTISNSDIEEILAKKIISKLDETGTACAPTLDILRISILNNPYFVPKTSNPINNAKIISSSYNVPKVIVVSSKVVVKNPNQQKEYWNNMKIPAISQIEPNYQLVTTVTMYDMKTDQILWSDVYNRNLNKVSEGKNAIKIASVNSYYDEITNKLVSDLKTTKSTSAILVSDKIPQWGKTTTDTKSISTADKTNETAAIKPTIIKPAKQKVTKVKLAKTPKESFIKKLQSGFNDKYTAYKKSQQERNIKKAEKLVIKTENEVNGVKEIKNKSVTEKKIKEVNKAKAANEKQVKVAKQNDKKDLKKSITTSIDKLKRDLKNYMDEKEAQKAQKLVQKKESNIVKISDKKPAQKKKSTDKVTKEKKKSVSPTLADRIKNKYNSVKKAYEDKKIRNMNLEENIQHYTTVTAPTIDGVPNVNTYIQTKPRNNSWNYIPKFNSLVNDI